MDDDDLRRGRPTCHKKFGEATAILAGDALLTRSFEILVGDLPPAVAVACCGALAEAAGATGMVGGQADDLASQINDTVRDPESSLKALQSIHCRKTGALFGACVRLGALVAGAGQAEMLGLDSYSRHLGLAFQIVDDLLDVSGEEVAAGKRVGKDTQRGKMTFPRLLGNEESRRRAGQLIDQACAALTPLGAGAANLEALARFVLERDR
jgi:geranylgeranyl diphosphate synthase type II